ncbi:MAG TPA: hypothetical protein VET88_15810 [Gammaproteobacteria bacterium]|nr:hypothetical protein [Gammaproteobacteria bacterium]
MSANRPPQLPWKLLLLDLAGTLLIAIGLYEQFAPGAGLLPEALAFPYHEGVLIITGLAAMIPAVSGLFAFLARTRRR